MANYVKMRMLITPVKNREDEFNNFCNLLENDIDDFPNAIGSNSEYNWVNDSDGPDCGRTDALPDGYVYLTMYYKTYSFDEETVKEFFEALVNRFQVNVDCVFSDEFESLNNVGTGVFRIKFDYDEKGNPIFHDLYQEPRNEKELHEMFLMAWDDESTVSPNNFFNQNGIDDDYFYEKEEEGNGEYFNVLPHFSDWLSKYTV